ncbi:MAG: succinate dehydrogenase assembly factor 2 [Rhodobacteraceae bacterium]|nr:succinate dehydrogenase assembly factor 2 [Paracoccaceae bacterium]
MAETREIQIKRMKLRAMRRGIREMDLILSTYADARLDGMSEGELALFDQLLGENDQDLYAWVTGQSPAEGQFAAMIEDIAGTYQK